ncbi:MAG: alanine--tRNA ligase, partial [Ruminococcaceae bacterium]|nr:alanine--tRNA ligase [Oscillospiraceae bacterium]
DFFVEREHYLLESASLIPKDDKSLLLINSGMAPLKKYFLGQLKVPKNRATSCQKCIRTPDIERVGKTSRHGTFFEMLGNFSFGDYFKKEAIEWAWELLTKVWEIPVEKLFVSVFSEDDEAYSIWVDGIGVEKERVIFLGREDNFWEIGAGPCGPCSEIYFDRGEENGCGKDDCKPGCDCDRFVEVWNLVFTQYISDGEGNYKKMDTGNIDTGMGLERISAIMQGVDNLFEVDTIRNIMKHIERISDTKYKEDENKDISLRIITDHVRSIVFMVGDGISPSNEGRGYVLRRLLRRAARHGRLLGVERPFLYEVADTVINENLKAYPYLYSMKDHIKNVIKSEEERFLKTVVQGLEMLSEIISKAKWTNKTVIEGSKVFKLYDTFGFPLDLTVEILEEKGIAVDVDGFNLLMNEQRERARGERKKIDDEGWEEDVFSHLDIEKSEFVGYETLKTSSKVLYLVHENESIAAASEGMKVSIILDKTPFYAESGGQVGDTGKMKGENSLVTITGCISNEREIFIHEGEVLSGDLHVGDVVEAAVDKNRRDAIARNHTSVHLLHSALRRVLGNHVHQAGSYVDETRSRFDFSHYSAIDKKQLAEIENMINEKILEDLKVGVSFVSREQSEKIGAQALFDEKYGEVVRVVDIEGFSKELCGGTHVTNTAKIGLYRLLTESSVAAGVRRIEATTGFGVIENLNNHKRILDEVAEVLKIGNIFDIPKRTVAILENLKQLERELSRLKIVEAKGKLDNLFDSFEMVDGIEVRVAEVEGMNHEQLRRIADEYKGNIDNSVTVIASKIDDEKVSIVAAFGKDAVKRGLKAGEVVNKIAKIASGSGGGKADLAMAGAKKPEKIQEALKSVVRFVREGLEMEDKNE